MSKTVPNLAVHDPPYGIRAKMSWGFGDGNMGGKARRGKFQPVFGDDSEFDPSHLLASGKVVVLWGANHYANKLPPSSAWLVWDKRVTIPPNHQSDCELAWVSIGNTARIIRHRWNGMVKDSERGEPRMHPTQKPVAVMCDIIQRFTGEGDLVTDWYLGSGSTLLACEQTRRVCLGVEIVPAYCDVVMARWVASGGPEPILRRRREVTRTQGVDTDG